MNDTIGITGINLVGVGNLKILINGFFLGWLLRKGTNMLPVAKQQCRY